VSTCTQDGEHSRSGGGNHPAERIETSRCTHQLGKGNIIVKDEGRLPTGSFKARGLELAEQFDWQLPDVIFYPTGGGTGLIGMWQMFDDLEAMDWIDSKRPRMVALQATGCAPIVKAWQDGEEHAPLWENALTVAAGISVPIAVGDFLILRAVRASNGFAITVVDEDIMQALTEVGQAEGLLLCPEGAATYAAYKQALAQGLVSKEETVILFNCATGLKYPLGQAPLHLDRNYPIDYSQL
jgi:threonine synthase